MINIGIIANIDRDADLKYTTLLAKTVIEKGGQVRILSWLSEAIKMGVPCDDEDKVIEESEIVICLGGDGTFLKVARKIYKRDIPILGINLGNLGFLTDIDRNDIAQAVSHIFNRNYKIQERMMLEADVWRKNQLIATDIALNDVVISRGAISRILHAKAYVDSVFVDSFPGDGLIVSSPTGSTAYSLSGGGPIVEPDTNLMIITPICPHILYSRSFITKPESLIKVVVDEDFQHNAMVTFDGQEGYEIRGGDWVEVRKSPFTVKLLKINSRNFFNILRTKIYYRGESFERNEI